MGKKLVHCPSCGWTYNEKNQKVFGHFRVYQDMMHHSKEEYLILKCRKCGTQFKVMLKKDQDPLLVEMSK